MGNARVSTDDRGQTTESQLLALRSVAAREHHDKIRLFLDFAPPGLQFRSVPDPYYGGPVGFERVLDLVEATVEGLFAELRRRSGPRQPRAGG